MFAIKYSTVCVYSLCIGDDPYLATQGQHSESILAEPNNKLA